ncbi:MAG: hypothetical protein N3A38_14955 [Planctomycetota bacterium]|nr:hypothetical protein [Planctomycetota bacterium]
MIAGLDDATREKIREFLRENSSDLRDLPYGLFAAYLALAAAPAAAVAVGGPNVADIADAERILAARDAAFAAVARYELENAEKAARLRARFFEFVAGLGAEALKVCAGMIALNAEGWRWR